MKSKKGLGVVIATSLFLVVSIVAVIGFQMWFNTYSSQNQVKVEDRSSQVDSLRVEGIVNNKLYIKSDSQKNLNFFKIIDSNNNLKCNLNTFLSENLISYFSFDSRNTTHIFDSSENQINATLVNGPSQTSGMLGNGLFFDEVNHEYMYRDILYPINYSFSISLWFKSNDSQGDLVSLAHGSGSIYGVRVFLYYDDLRFISEEEYNFSNPGSEQIYDYTYSSSVVNDNTWHHVVYTRDAENKNASYYIDNELVHSVIDNISTNLGTGYRFRLGRSAFTNNNNYNYTGTIDEFRMYNKTLSSAEVNQLYFNINSGMSAYNIASCNLTEGETYEVVAFTSTSSIQQKVVAK